MLANIQNPARHQSKHQRDIERDKGRWNRCIDLPYPLPGIDSRHYTAVSFAAQVKLICYTSLPDTIGVSRQRPITTFVARRGYGVERVRATGERKVRPRSDNWENIHKGEDSVRIIK